jgi:RNA polymerase sigma factor (sigma-70 family)
MAMALRVMVTSQQLRHLRSLSPEPADKDDERGSRPAGAATKPDVTNYLDLVRTARAKLLSRTGGATPVLADRDDLFSAGCVALIRAANKHDGRSGFATFAWRCIWAAMVDELRKHGPINQSGKRRPEVISFSTSLGDGDQTASVTLGETVPAQGASVDEQVEAREALADVFALPPRPREALLRRGMGESTEEIAESLGVSASRVSQIISDYYRKSA